MAYIKKRDKRWRVLVRKKRYRPVSETCGAKTAVLRWANQTGERIENRAFSGVGDLASVTVGALIERYIEGSDPGGTRHKAKDLH